MFVWVHNWQSLLRFVATLKKNVPVKSGNKSYEASADICTTFIFCITIWELHLWRFIYRSIALYVYFSALYRLNSPTNLSSPLLTDDITLDFSYSKENSSTLADRISEIRDSNYMLNYFEIIFMSVAHSNLTRIPNDVLSLVKKTLKYLSLAGNDFSQDEPQPNSHNTRSNFSTHLFSKMEELKELDLRQCNIHNLRDGSFESLDKLEKLFLSDNYIAEISATVFRDVINLVHLDLSHNHVDESSLTRDEITKTLEVFVSY